MFIFQFKMNGSLLFLGFLFFSITILCSISLYCLKEYICCSVETSVIEC